MTHRLLDSLALTVAVTLATGAVMLGAAYAPAPHGDAELDSLATATSPVGLVSWAVHAVEVPEAPPAARAVLGAVPPALDECRHEAERMLQQGAGGSDRLFLESGSGAVRVDGRPGLEQVRVVARLCASEESYLEHMDVTLERQGSTLELRTHYPERRERARWGNDYARLDLVVEVPGGMDADVEDGSGALELNGLGSLRIDDGSGDIAVQGARDVRIVDGSGGIRVREARGDVEIDDGSGEIDVDGVEGNVTVIDGSGSISVRRVSGDVIVRDGSGSIDVRGVGGDFIVRADGSGSLNWSEVSGRVQVPEKHRASRRSWRGQS
ncbi:MAG TPA: DUF4097 family beta strand repeat-containing protein [Longimicrobiales bacterium]|nr:DUF4097 family beta strand repeat-containing protein [Longimicrobiales bacterium]